LLSALGEPFPEVVDLFLGLAADLEGDGLVEGELRAAVDGDEPLARDLEPTVITVPAGPGLPSG